MQVRYRAALRPEDYSMLSVSRKRIELYSKLMKYQNFSLIMLFFENNQQVFELCDHLFDHLLVLGAVIFGFIAG